jgi:hypothetical protein
MTPGLSRTLSAPLSDEMLSLSYAFTFLINTGSADLSSQFETGVDKPVKLLPPVLFIYW